MTEPRVEVELPGWTAQHIERFPAGGDDAARMRFVIGLARENVRRGTGGPFAAAVIDSGTGRLVAIGVNLVTTARSSLLHAEIVAILGAQRHTGSYTLAADGARHELIASCEPCAMCFGAVLWSGVRRLVCGATKADAEAIGFDEGPVDERSWQHLAARGIAVARHVERDAARAVLQSYASAAGTIYNG
jgi:tRNA(Arg) A34 adenosine deaminase TadA